VVAYNLIRHLYALLHCCADQEVYQMEGVLAILGFWLCMIAIVMKKPFMAYIEQMKVQQNDATRLMDARVRELEGAVSSLGTNMSELKESTEFAHKMIIESSKKLAESPQLLIESSQKFSQPQINHIEQVENPVKATVVQPAVAPQSGSHGSVDSTSRPLLPPPERPLLTNNQSYDPNIGRVVNESTIQFERVLPAPVNRVWQYLTNSDFLSSWLAIANIECRAGGRVELQFDQNEIPERAEQGSKIRGLVSAYEAERKLEYSWIDTKSHLESTVSFELTAQGNETVLTVTHSRIPSARLHEFMAAWHAHLDILTARLKNAVPPSFQKRFREVVQTYAMLAASFIISIGPASAASDMADSRQAVQAERSHLMTRYDNIWREADDLHRQIDILKRDNSDESSRAVARLEKALQDEYRDLHQVELDIRDINMVLQ
jgi:uncharacterized protein YndB with AHSA1/START domain